MATFQKAPQSVVDLANSILCEYESHKPLLDAKVRIDYVFAFGERDEKTGALVSDALKHHGVRAFGIARKLGLKDRAMNRGDAEISLDADWWEEANDRQRRALLDHELHHLAVKIDKRGIVRDDLGRPMIKLRNHDVDFGWFRVIAERHGEFSIERHQAAVLWDNYKQSFWPSIVEA